MEFGVNEESFKPALPAKTPDVRIRHGRQSARPFSRALRVPLPLEGFPVRLLPAHPLLISQRDYLKIFPAGIAR
jgi:hypothetical protein